MQITQQDDVRKAMKINFYMKLFFCSAATLVLLFCIGIFLFDSLGDPNRASDELRCELNLHRIWWHLERYVAEKGDIPKDERGLFFLATFSEDAEASQRNWLKCPSQPNDDSRYIVSPRLKSPEQLVLGGLRPIPIVMDPTPKHYISGTGETVAYMLFSDRRIYFFRGSANEYAHWVDQLDTPNGKDLPPGFSYAADGTVVPGVPVPRSRNDVH